MAKRKRGKKRMAPPDPAPVPTSSEAGLKPEDFLPAKETPEPVTATAEVPALDCDALNAAAEAFTGVLKRPQAHGGGAQGAGVVD